ncbi:MAG: cation transporter [Saprospiraceae bacterium]|nr:cation transporter [Saprospiraceae bacterium]
MTTAEKAKLSIQKWILTIGIVLFVAKMSAYFITGSIGILSDALESTVNVFTGIMTYFSLKYSLKPKDLDHPYGHGKIELITASVEGILIAIAGFYIIYEAMMRFFQPAKVEQVGLGILLIGICGLINYVLAIYSIRIGEKHHSMALIAGGQHLKTDTYTSLGLIVGLVLVMWTGLLWIDSVVAVIFGLIIWKGAYDILRHTSMALMDKTDVDVLHKLSRHLSANHKPEWIYAHKLTALHFGHVIHLDMHLTLPYYYTLRQSIQEVKEIKSLMAQVLEKEQIDISIQTEPCHPGLCGFCNVDCPFRSFGLEKPLQWDTELLTGGNQFKAK